MVMLTYLLDMPHAPDCGQSDGDEELSHDPHLDLPGWVWPTP